MKKSAEAGVYRFRRRQRAIPLQRLPLQSLPLQSRQRQTQLPPWMCLPKRSSPPQTLAHLTSHFIYKALEKDGLFIGGVLARHLLLLVLTLRGPSGGHCVELHCEAYLDRKQWALRAHCLRPIGFCEPETKAPRSGPRRVSASLGLKLDIWEILGYTMLEIVLSFQGSLLDIKEGRVIAVSPGVKCCPFDGSRIIVLQ